MVCHLLSFVFYILLMISPFFCYGIEYTEDMNTSTLTYKNHTELYEYPEALSDIFFGTWKINETNFEFPDSIWSFEKNQGRVVFHLSTSESNASRGLDRIIGFLELRDGPYTTDPYLKYHLFGLYQRQTGKAIAMGIPIDNEFSEIEETIAGRLKNDTSFVDNLFRNQNWDSVPEEMEFECLLMVHIQLEPLSAEDVATLDARGTSFDPRIRDKDEPLLFMDFRLVSESCKFELEGNVSPIIFQEYYDKAIIYALCAAILATFEVFLATKQMESSSTQSAASRVSMATIGWQAVLDCFLSLFHLSVGIFFEPIMHAFLCVSAMKFVGFSIFHIRFILNIWKARRRPSSDANAMDHWELLRRQITLIYTRLYLSLFCLLACFYIFPSFIPLILLGAYSYWVPQIFCNVSRDTRFALNKFYIIGTSVTRLFTPLYFYGCPYNFFHMEANHFIWVLVLWQCIQIAVIFAQDRWGARFFIPKNILPPKYDYHHISDLDVNCVICMNSLESKTNVYMITPCNHVYHPQCLEKWMDVKLACPTCRGPLPVP